ncbi:MAG: alpha/beta fold hydrolase [Blastocatellia bacterium]|nr:alpha/beta fold hydrolase [Blastocatellia bacterium]
MRLFSRLVCLWFMTLACTGTVWAQGEASLVPRQAFFADPDKEQVQLSSDGKWVSYLAQADNTMKIWVAPANDPAKASVVTQPQSPPILNYRWTYLPGQLLYAVPVEQGVHIFLLDLASGEARDLTPAKNVVAAIEKFSSDHVDEVLLRIREPNSSTPFYRRVNLRTAAAEVIFKNDRNFERVFFDDDWKPRVAKLPQSDTGYELVKRNSNGAWVPLASFRGEAEVTASQPITLDKTGRTLYLTDNRGRDTAALMALDLETGKETLLFGDPVADMMPALLLHPRTGRVQTVASSYGRLRRHFLDPSVIPDFEYLRTVQRGDIGLLSPSGGRSLDDHTWLVQFMDGGPKRFYLYDRLARRATFLFTENKALDAYALGRRYLEVIPARDGMEFPADLYLPKQADANANGRPRQPLPLLMYVHGGPWVAYPWNDWLTNRLLNLLADRGYAVLRVEFRGVHGLGRTVYEAGAGEWGGKMQDDLVDAADWAVKQGIATRGRIGIWGWSYGGYATLAALATSDRFACGLVMYAPTELDSFINETIPDVQPFLRQRIGDNTTDKGRAALRNQSPIHSVAGFNKPVLIAQGGKDEIVHQGQADRFVEAMQKHRKPVTYILYPEEPHDLRESENWISLFAVAEQFFQQHLGGRAEPLGADLRGHLEVRAGSELIPGLSVSLSKAQSAKPKGTP